MTLMPVEGGGCLILKRQESIPTFFRVKVCTYVQPSRIVPKSRLCGCTSNPLTMPPVIVEEV